jgi:hypothetical protein
MMTAEEAERIYDETAFEAGNRHGIEHGDRVLTDPALFAKCIADTKHAGLLAVAAEAERRGREAVVASVAAVSLDAMREVGMQCDSYHEAMRALFVRAAKVTP